MHIPLRNSQDIDLSISNLNNAIINAVKEATPQLTISNTFTKFSSPPVRELIKEKRELRKRWQITRAPADKAKFNKAVKTLKEILKKEQNESIQRYLETLTPTENTDYSLWRATRKLKQQKNAKSALKKEDGSWARSNQEKADLFAQHLAGVFTPFPSQSTQEEETRIKEALHNDIVPVNLPNKFRKTEVKEVIKRSVNIKKAPGQDQISGKILRELPEVGITILTYIFNAMLKLEYFPNQWKTAQIILIPKQGKDLTEKSSYRPISLLSTISKVFEKLLLTRMKPILEAKQIIPTHQFGFREQHTTIEQVHRIASIIKQNLEKKKYCSAVFLDVSQAFDKVWHDGLLYKVKDSIPQFFGILKSYIQERSFIVKQEDATSVPLTIKSGVPQGSVLGPFLYLLYTADLPTPDDRSVSIATFADDTAILASHYNPVRASQKLQEHISKIELWLSAWRIKVNEYKSVHITFTTRRKTCPPIQLNNCTLPQQEEVKYLGIHLDRRLTWKKHIWTKRKQLGLQLTKMYWLMGRKSKLSLDNKLLLYKTILKPIWTYGIQLWGSASVSNIEIIQRFQSKTLRMIADAPWFVPNSIIHHDLQIQTIKEEISRWSTRHRNKLENHPNSLAAELLSQRRINRLKKADPLDLPQRFGQR